MKKLFLVFVLIVSLLVTNFAFAIDGLSSMDFIGMNIEIGVFRDNIRSLETTIVRGKLVNVVNGRDLGGNVLDVIHWYLIMKIISSEGTEKVITVPCKYVNYILELS